MKIKDLVGYQLVKIDDDKIIVSKDNKTYVLNIEEDCGGCCGYNDIKTEMFFEENNKNNPIITSVNDDDSLGSSECKITFYGLDKELATIKSESGSGSGWMYGACVTITCKELNMEEVITQY